MALWVYSVVFIEKVPEAKTYEGLRDEWILIKKNQKLYKNSLARHGFACCLTAVYF